MDKQSRSIPLTPHQLAERYIEESLLQPATIKHYRSVAQLFEKDMGPKPLSEIDKNCVLKWRKAVLARAQPATWNTYRRQLNLIWNYALRNQWITANPFQEVRSAPVLKKLKKTIPDDLLISALDSLEDPKNLVDPAWFWLIAVKLIYATGMRRRQLTSLRWRDIDFDQEIILLRAEGCKTKREWEIPLPENCFEDLVYLRQRTQEVSPRACAMNQQVFRVQLFNHKYSGTELSPDQLSGFFKRLSRILNASISSHRLRHTMATELAKGENPKLRDLQHVLGHTDIRTTLEYVHPDRDQLRRFLNQLPLPPRKPD